MLVKQELTWRYYAVECAKCARRSVSMADPAEARRMARNDGWARVCLNTGQEVDLCPACKREFAKHRFAVLGEALCDVPGI